MSTLRIVILPVLAITAVCAVVAGFLGGTDSVVGALVGGLMVSLFLSSSASILEPVTKKEPSLSLLVALTLFTGKVAVMLVLLAVFLNSDDLASKVDGRALGLTVLITSLCCTVLQIMQYRRRRIPAYDLSDDE